MFFKWQNCIKCHLYLVPFQFSVISNHKIQIVRWRTFYKVLLNIIRKTQDTHAQMTWIRILIINMSDIKFIAIITFICFLTELEILTRWIYKCISSACQPILFIILCLQIFFFKNSIFPEFNFWYLCISEFVLIKFPPKYVKNAMGLLVLIYVI